jgi:hypothetical protein
MIGLAVRRFFCEDPVCPAATFAEQVEGLTSGMRAAYRCSNQIC